MEVLKSQFELRVMQDAVKFLSLVWFGDFFSFSWAILT